MLLPVIKHLATGSSWPVSTTPTQHAHVGF
jgi:hypothetical protein